MRPQGRPKFMETIPTLLLPIKCWEHEPELWIFISKMALYATWDTSAFFQENMQRWFGKPSSGRCQDTLVLTRLWQYCKVLSLVKTLTRCHKVYCCSHRNQTFKHRGSTCRTIIRINTYCGPIDQSVCITQWWFIYTKVNIIGAVKPPPTTHLLSLF